MRLTTLPILISATLLLSLSCSALHPAEEDGLANQVAALGAYQKDYAKIDCEGCQACVTMKSVVNETAAAGAGFNAIGAKEAQVRAYLSAVDLAIPSPTPDCGCVQDHDVCSYAKHALDVARLNLSVNKTLDQAPWYQLLFSGLLGQ